VPETLCIKASVRIDGWLREAYFGQLLKEHPRAIRVFDAFPVLRPEGACSTASRSSTRHRRPQRVSRANGQGLSERLARREIAGILDVLGRLHRGQHLHRDLTPMNVFVCDGPRLKLGDFGIVRQQSERRGITAHTLNRSMVPSDFLDGAAPKWQARDDVYQVGQLLGMLVRGTRETRIRTAKCVSSRAAIT
jgi:serine/threonine protein kinase